MNRYLLMGLFAFAMFAITAWRVLADRDLARLGRIKKIWGRTLGLGIHFSVNIGLPLVFGIVFVSMGIAGFDPRKADFSFSSLPELPLEQVSLGSSVLKISLLEKDEFPSFISEESLMP